MFYPRLQVFPVPGLQIMCIPKLWYICNQNIKSSAIRKYHGKVQVVKPDLSGILSEDSPDSELTYSF